MLFVFDSNVTLLIPPWNCDFDRPLGLRNSFQSSFPNTRFKEAVSIVQGMEKEYKVWSQAALNFCQSPLPKFHFGTPRSSGVVLAWTAVKTTDWSLPKTSLITVEVQKEAHDLETSTKSNRLHALRPVSERWVGVVICNCYGKEYYFIWLVGQDTFSAFSYIRNAYMGSSMDVTRTVFTKAMFAWPP